MLIPSRRNGFDHPLSSEITPLSAYQDRRALLRLAAGGAIGTALAGWAGGQAGHGAAAALERPGKLAALGGAVSQVPGATTMKSSPRTKTPAPTTIFTSLAPTKPTRRATPIR